MKVLVVDDRSILRDGVKEVLERGIDGIEVLLASSGEEAFEMISIGRFDGRTLTVRPGRFSG